MRLHLQVFGAGRPLVLLHGLFGSADNWRPVALRLAERRQVLVVDQRNHGASPHDARMDYSLMAGDLNALLEARGLGGAAIVGHSLGGKTAMQFALEFPERVEKLLVADMAPRAYAPVHAPILQALRALELPQYQTRQQVEAVLEPDIPDLFLRRFLLKNLGRDAAGGFVWKINLQGIADNYHSHLCAATAATTTYAGPALFLRGGKSDYVRPEDEARIRELFPTVEFQTLEGAGHWVHADQPEEFIRRAEAFL